MKNRVDRKKFEVLLKIMIVALSFATGAVAGEGWHDRRPVERPLKQVVENVDRTDRTVTIGGEIYAVTTKTMLLDASGDRIELGQLRGIESEGDGDMVDFTFKRSGKHGVAEIRRLQVADLLIR